MSTERTIRNVVEQASTTVGLAWPLHSFVTANPLAGFEDQPFHEAVQQAERLFDAEGYPSPEMFRQAWDTGQIDPDILAARLDDHGYDSDPETLLDRMATAREQSDETASVAAADRVDEVLTKWLAAFLDQGRTHWSMPDREQGFYAAFCTVAPHDREIPDRSVVADLPDDPVAAIERVAGSCPEDRLTSVFEYHLTALPGWVGFIRQRAAGEGEWQSTYPITLLEYLAVRLTLVDLFDAPVEPPESAMDAADAAKTGAAGTLTNGASDARKNGAATGATTNGAEPAVGTSAGTDGRPPLEEVWLSAWEATYRDDLVGAVSAASAESAGTVDENRPDAQLVFCIDTRSEIIRRHIEATGNYETHGYAGFFGIPMRYQGYDSDVTVDACPPIVDPQHRIADRPTGGADTAQESYDTWWSAFDAGADVVESLKSNAATAFSFVESAGVGYGVTLAARTLLPSRVYDVLETSDERVPDDHEFVDPDLAHDPDADCSLPAGLTLEQRVEYAAAAFDMMGWEEFARVVVFAGHASQTANNPFDSSLDCGACAGNPGGPSARVLAAICNEAAVREALRDRGFEIPADTVFVAGQHNTTTDEVELYAGDVPESHAADIEQLRTDLETARAGATAERADDMAAGQESGIRETQRRAADWAEPRPEWGLAGNAAFVIGPRALTDGLDLDGRSFLHSYDWTTDPDGDALEGIVAGPMVVTQWINTQYYFATVDQAVFGSGSKVTHNPVGNVGVYQGNGGDLMTGLPLQSLLSADDELYHQPLRLSTVIHAPVARVTGILADNEEIAELLDNGWLSLTVVDPQQDHRAFHYDGQLEWTPASGDGEPTTDEPRTSPSVADD
jgi:uncharacterized protein YbcC (UPF0753/DUF2309 family)